MCRERLSLILSLLWIRSSNCKKQRGVESVVRCFSLLLSKSTQVQTLKNYQISFRKILINN